MKKTILIFTLISLIIFTGVVIAKNNNEVKEVDQHIIIEKIEELEEKIDLLKKGQLKEENFNDIKDTIQNILNKLEDKKEEKESEGDLVKKEDLLKKGDYVKMEGVFNITLIDYKTMDVIPEADEDDQADEGYQWLKIYITAQNIDTTSNEFLGVRASDFYFISEEGLEFRNTLIGEDHIETDYFKPNQKFDGYIYFEIPKNENIEKGKLQYERRKLPRFEWKSEEIKINKLPYGFYAKPSHNE